MEDYENAISLDQISFSYAADSIAVFEKINFDIRTGQKIGIIGPNGSGKSTLLHLIMGLLHPSAGKISLLGQSMHSEKDYVVARKNIGFVFQDADDQLFSPTVLEDVAFGPLNLGFSQVVAKDKALSTLAKLGLSGFKDRITYKLSGGEKKMIALATALVMEPDILILDEPTTGLDPDTIERIIGILNQLSITLLIVSHRYDFLEKVTEKMIRMQDIN